MTFFQTFSKSRPPGRAALIVVAYTRVMVDVLAVGRNSAVSAALVLGALLGGGGCKMPNPAWSATTDGPATDTVAGTTAGGASSSSGSIEDPSTTVTGEPDTSSTTQSASETTGGTSTTSPITSSTAEPTTSGTTGVALCEGPTETVELTAIADTFVINKGPGGVTLQCEPECANYNFGEAMSLDLINLNEHFRLFLVEFPELPPPYDQFLVEWITSVRFELWFSIKNGEALGFPITLKLHRLAEEDAWYEGAQGGAPAVDGDSSFHCRKIDGEECATWGVAPEDTPLTLAAHLGEVALMPGDLQGSAKIDWTVTGAGLEKLADWFESPGPTHRSVVLEQQQTVQPDHLIVPTRELDDGALAAKMFVTFTCPDDG